MTEMNLKFISLCCKPNYIAMKNRYFLSAIAFLTTLSGITVSAYSQQQAAPSFHKGSFRINLTEGSAHSTYTTNDISSHEVINSMRFIGDRDPLQLEYGLTGRWGIGLTTGNDIFNNINPTGFYGFQTSTGQVKAKTSELTVDGSYHFFITPVSDFSVVGSVGPASVLIQGGTGDMVYQYNAGGGIIRLGLHARCFILRYIGVVAMVSVYSENMSPEGVKGNTAGTNYSTSISGVDIEGGLCFRFSRK